MRLIGNPHHVFIGTGSNAATDFDTGGVTQTHSPKPRLTQGTPIAAGWGLCVVSHSPGVVFQNNKMHALGVPFAPQPAEAPKRYHIHGAVFANNQKIGWSWFIGRCGLGALSTSDSGTTLTDVMWIGADRVTTQAGFSNAYINRIVDFSTDEAHLLSCWIFGLVLSNLAGSAVSPGVRGHYSVRRYDTQHWPEDPYQL